MRWLLDDPTLVVTNVLSTEFQFVARRGDSLLQVQRPDGQTFGALAELQLLYDAKMPARVQNYTAMARQKFEMPIVPIVVYLTEPGPDTEVVTAYHSEFMGLVTHQDFKVIKMWELDAHEALAQNLPASLIPYVPLMAGADEAVLRECVRRIRTEPDHEELETILALFAMIKLDPAVVERIVRWHVTLLEKSPIYQEILEKGVEQGLERGLEWSIVRVLQRRFGEVPASVRQSLEQTPLEKLEALLDEALVAADLDAFQERLAAMKQDRQD
ncbi:MAG: DUF4351 domain-containing protein [Chloroflexi bacterium]|nr:DUF4351 domain-containing protein [Chloroflexota bacterium]MCI0574612.1 DUF4351 domain-containing protein [Chloroflexota bacterium]MCI0644036.1 DUF4351 domain-containing protein [Chloroflexota bacterium]MCI0731710.1 DUF4351 domain-containing protein [Chloroflexota bacterium]